MLPIVGTPLWDTLAARPPSSPRYHTQSFQLSQFLHGEQGALICAAKIVQDVPAIESKFYAATQVMDEARHVEAYRRLLTDKFRFVYPITGPLKELLERAIADRRWDFTYLGMQVLIEGLALSAFQRFRDYARNPLCSAVNAYVMQDEARHVAVGRLALRDYYPRLTEAERAWLQTQAFRAYDNDSGMTMLRIGSMNLMLHGIEQPRFFYMDTLSKAFGETKAYDVILMNPPFKGAVDKNDLHPTLAVGTTKSELLFLHLILRALDMGGRCAVIVPDGVLFGSSKAHVAIRRKLIEENRLEGVVSMPSGVFKPYAGVSTAVLIFTRGATTDRIWFYDMEHDGFSLNDKRQPVAENDLPDILRCWQQRKDEAFQAERDRRLNELKAQVAPLKAERLKMQAELNRTMFDQTQRVSKTLWVW